MSLQGDAIGHRASPLGPVGLGMTEMHDCRYQGQSQSKTFDRKEGMHEESMLKVYSMMTH